MDWVEFGTGFFDGSVGLVFHEELFSGHPTASLFMGDVYVAHPPPFTGVLLLLEGCAYRNRTVGGKRLGSAVSQRDRKRHGRGF